MGLGDTSQNALQLEQHPRSVEKRDARVSPEAMTLGAVKSNCVRFLGVRGSPSVPWDHEGEAGSNDLRKICCEICLVQTLVLRLKVHLLRTSQTGVRLSIWSATEPYHGAETYPYRASSQADPKSTT